LYLRCNQKLVLLLALLERTWSKCDDREVARNDKMDMTGRSGKRKAA